MNHPLPLAARPRGRSLVWIVCVVALLVGTRTLLADTTPPAPGAVGQVTTTKPVIDNGLTAWMLMSSALVLFMVPGLALFYGGMVRAKNVLNMFLCVMVAIGVIGLHWVVLGYAMAFPTVGSGTTRTLVSYGVNADASDAIISLLSFDPKLLLLKSFNTDMYRIVSSGDTLNPRPTGVPELAFVMFQGKFAIITPALIVGAVAERVRFGPFVIFMLIWSTIVYCPVAHSVWNVNGYFFQKGVFDFAGGTVVHVLGGVSGLALALILGPRRGYGRVAMPPHSLGLTLIGAGLLWFGWFGFNAGSSIAIPGGELGDFMGIASRAFATTQVAAAAAATVWMLVEWMHAGKPTILGFASGMVAGLVVITPCAGHVNPDSAMLIGAIGGAVCYFGCQAKKLFGYDDSLDAFGVHGVGGALGALLVGWFAVRPTMGSGHQVWLQFQALAFAAVFAFVATYVIGIIIHKTIGLRVTEDQEQEGLDVTLHGETGYNLSTTI